MRVLIVEDQAILALGLEALLAELGHEVVGIARDYPSALRLAGRHEPDLALVDVILADGVTGVDIMLALRTLHDVPTVFVTASAREIPEEARRLAVGLVTKPYHDRALMTELDAAQSRIGDPSEERRSAKRR